MAFKGTTKRPSAMDIASLIDGVGGECNAFTSKEITGYYVKAASTNVDLCLDVLSDMLQNSKFDQVEIDKEKGVILEEKNLYEDTPSRHIGDLYEILLYGDTPLGREIIGTKEVINGINRQDFITYMQSLYSASNLTVVVAGGIDTAEIESKVENYFGQMPTFDTVKYEKQLENQIKPELFVQKKDYRAGSHRHWISEQFLWKMKKNTLFQFFLQFWVAE
jgi:predicted Zn-dependent peptidase